MPLFTCQADLSQSSLLEPTTFESEQLLEARLRDLLEQHLPCLLPAQPLMVIAAEYGAWSNAKRSIDLLAMDEEAQLYVVEIKRTGDGGHAELQALRYAAMLSNHTIEHVVDARHHQLLKKRTDARRDEAQAEILEFLGEPDISTVKLGTTPQVILVARDFSPEITTTAMWLMERMDGFKMYCFTVQLYALGNGNHALYIDLLIPLPQQEDYLVQVRDRNAAMARQTAVASARRQRTCPLLEAAGKLRTGDALYLVKPIHKNLPPLAESERQAIYLGEGKVRWNGREFSSLTDLTLHLRNQIQPPISAIPGTEFWGLQKDGPSLAQLANTLTV
ncbi:MAG: hypothetical protein ACOY5G_09575 [Pseudomonadota bacterium]|jgi:hypothetical protein